jgi:hypothetical protein
MATWRCFSYQLTKVCVRDRDQSPSAALEQPARRSLRLERSLLWVNEFRDCWLGRRGGCCGLGLSWCCRCSRRALARGVALGSHSHSHVGLVDYDALCLVTLRLVAMTSWSSFRDGLTIPYRTSYLAQPRPLPLLLRHVSRPFWGVLDAFSIFSER